MPQDIRSNVSYIILNAVFWNVVKIVFFKKFKIFLYIFLDRLYVMISKIIF